MKIDLNEYRKKLEGCWLGKSIGGTLGAPFECKRGVFDIDFYTQELSGEPIPNDDLDLQLVWLNVVEKYGKNTRAEILGEYWQTYIVPNWAEYGAGKNNLRIGLVPPISGYMDNLYRDSCGAFIRSEIWACIAPGHPDIAVRYAYEDAIIDHSNEGLFAEIFCAAVESAAFVEKDKYKLIDIGLSYIPKDCGIATGVKTAMNTYQGGSTWQEARINVLKTVPGSFGMLMTLPEDVGDDIPVGSIGWDAPSNIGLLIIGWLYGENDFGRSLCIAASCGEDADCTAATLGALLGIINGIDEIPEKWIEPIGSSIKTICINQCDGGVSIPKTVAELTDRVIKVTPQFLGSEICDYVNSSSGYIVDMLEGDALYNSPKRVNMWWNQSFNELLESSPFVTRHEFVLFNVYLDYCVEPIIKENISKKFKLRLENKIYVQQWLNIKWHVPADWEVSPSSFVGASLEQFHCNVGITDIEFEITGHGINQPRYDLLIEITSNGRHTKGIVPVVLINKP
jgi:ADP-ribosylglycohydrolase